MTSEPGRALGIWQYGPDGRPERAPDRPVYFVREAANQLGAKRRRSA